MGRALKTQVLQGGDIQLSVKILIKSKINFQNLISLLTEISFHFETTQTCSPPYTLNALLNARQILNR